ncbi:MAG: hypothetical protein BJ554DRAFT_4869 [Olpidium bornovanus]|uniref:Uncharacterized protein n=1 Tax=Olpidium bornovanus TaxID=278681 RepID=A0A8H8A023_9FUNG|nr:MAG: hypothetical protein BJ554DRAFT_4869 [Olpidium bornovanus]
MEFPQTDNGLPYNQEHDNASTHLIKTSESLKTFKSESHHGCCSSSPNLSDPSGNDGSDSDTSSADRRRRSRDKKSSRHRSRSRLIDKEHVLAIRDAGKAMLADVKPYDGAGGPQRQLTFEEKLEEDQEVMNLPSKLFLQVAV